MGLRFAWKDDPRLAGRNFCPSNLLKFRPRRTGNIKNVFELISQVDVTRKFSSESGRFYRDSISKLLTHLLINFLIDRAMFFQRKKRFFLSQVCSRCNRTRIDRPHTKKRLPLFFVLLLSFSSQSGLTDASERKAETSSAKEQCHTFQ